jgi:hypothetical protein
MIMLIDRIEKIARLLLWLALSSAVVILPIAYIGHKAEETKAEVALAEQKGAVKKAEEKLEEIDKAKKNKSNRIALASVGTFLSGISYTKADGSLMFTNVSARTGVMCIVGIAQNPETNEKAESIPACVEVTPYASAVHTTVEFAGNDLTNACPKSNCRLTFREATEVPVKE